MIFPVKEIKQMNTAYVKSADRKMGGEVIPVPLEMVLLLLFVVNISATEASLFPLPMSMAITAALGAVLLINPISATHAYVREHGVAGAFRRTWKRFALLALCATGAVVLGGLIGSYALTI
ncbi:MAG: hypothetical protein CL472_07570 [Acidobacteria bacterium]|nr:hypothetical protein [Acidobacteriota bacterium]